MRKIIPAAVLIVLLAGCGVSDDSSGPSPDTSGSDSNATVTDDATAPDEPTTNPADLPSDVETIDNGESITYQLASNNLILTVPSGWTDVVESSQAFPVALENPEGTQRIVIAEIGGASVMPGTDSYRELLVKNLGVDDSAVVYLEKRLAGDHSYPTYKITTDDSTSWIFVVEANHKIYELTVSGTDANEGIAALAVVESLENHG